MDEQETTARETWVDVHEVHCWKWWCIWCQHRNTERVQPMVGGTVTCAECGRQARAALP